MQISGLMDMVFFTPRRTEEFRELFNLIKNNNPSCGIITIDPMDKSIIKCPKCKSINVQVMGNDRKGFSVGKAVGGAVLTGGVGVLAGFAGKKGKYDVLCSDCGHRFQAKG